MRASNKDIEVRLSPPRQMSLDEAIEYLSEDELLEVTSRKLPDPEEDIKYRRPWKTNKKV